MWRVFTVSFIMEIKIINISSLFLFNFKLAPALSLNYTFLIDCTKEISHSESQPWELLS
jgi:hypothetical protein